MNLHADVKDTDNFNHPIGAELNWNESRWFSISVPERNIHGFIYYFYRPNLKLAVGGPVFWDRPGSTIGNCLWYDWNGLQIVENPGDGVNIALPGGLAIESPRMGEYRFRYAMNGCEFDLEWRSIAPPHSSSATDEFSEGHYEMAGHCRGWLQFDGERFAVDCASMSDHSWGPRDFGGVPRGFYLSGMADDLAFNVLSFMEGDRARIADGFLLRDGETSRLTGGWVSVEDRGPSLPKIMLLEAQDNLSRTISARGEICNDLEFCGYPRLTFIWSLLKWDIAGRIVWGDQQEFIPRSAKAPSAAR